MLFRMWLVWKYMRSGNRFFNTTTLLSIAGMAIAVASLMVTMGVVSGYKFTLRQSVTDVFGHVVVARRKASVDWKDEIESRLRPKLQGLKAYSPFVTKEAVLARKGRLSGVVIQGIDEKTVGQVLKLDSHLIQGKFDLAEKDGLPGALAGKTLVEKFKLKLGDRFTLVVPLAKGYSSEDFRPKPQKFILRGVLDFGRHDFDSRNVVTDIKVAQDFAEVGNKVTGYRMRFNKDEEALAANTTINRFWVEESGEKYYPYWSTSWREVNSNLFAAADYEKWVIFFILLVLIVAACFNISSTLFVSVMRRYGDISILKAMGADQKTIRWIFSFQGLAVGLIGVVSGLALGSLACFAFVYAQEKWNIINAEVYKIDHIVIDFAPIDIAAIVFASLLICFVSTLAPARRGARLPCTEGLRYD